MQIGLRLVALCVWAFVCSCDKAPPLDPAATARLPDQSASLPRLATSTQYNLESVGSTTEPLLRNVDASVDASHDLTITGWAVDSHARQPAGAVEVVISGRAFKADYGLDRGDVASGLKQPAYRRSGFAVVVPANTLQAGVYSLSLKIVAANRDAYYDSPSVRLTVR